ncbi:MAG: sulfatase-like hydrolase/transferase [Myxococcales bacterium]|nr:sulfatase-like hydrolase/transferase [Myxococcales bacterium]
MTTLESWSARLAALPDSLRFTAIGATMGVVEAAYALASNAQRWSATAATIALAVVADGLALGIVATAVSSALARSARTHTGRAAWITRAMLAIAISCPIATVAVASLASRRHRVLASLAAATVTAGVSAAAHVFAALVVGRRWSVTRSSHTDAVARNSAFARELALATTFVLVAVLSVGTARWWPLVVEDRSIVIGATVGAIVMAPLIGAAARRWIERVSRDRAGLIIAGLVLVSLAIVAVRVRDAFEFAPRSAALWLLAPALVLLCRRRERHAAESKSALTVVVLLALVSTGALALRSETARKLVSTRTFVAAMTLRAVRTGLDFDRDGHARWLPGGDCRDDDAEVHPGAIDWPGDGIDSDCDGRDDTIHLPPRRPHVALPPSVAPSLNVLLLTIDAMRADHLGVHGYRRPTTPALDRLAREAVLFERGFANAPSTRLSMPAIATGRWAPTIEWDHSIFWPRFTAKQRTIAEVLHDHGIRTGAIYSIPYFRRTDARGFERGVDEYDDSLIHLHTEIGGPSESAGSSSAEVTDRALRFVRENSGRQWFLWAHYFDPHHQYVSHDDGETTFFGTAPIDRYDSEVQYTDRHIGRLLDALRASEQWSRTVVIVTGDHGEGFGEHNVSTHGFHLYSAQTRVPMIVRVPGIAPRRSMVPVSHVDLAPTIANLVRVPEVSSFLGRSMVDALLGSRSANDGEVFQEVTFDNTTHRWGLVTTSHHALWNQSPEATRECFDLTRDPDETLDLSDLPTVSHACEALALRLSRAAVALRLGPDASNALSYAIVPRGGPRPAPEHETTARIGGKLSVVGWDGPSTIRRDSSVTLVLHLEVLGRIERGWALFVHFAGDTVVRNLDHAVLGGAFPMDRWQPGQRLRDRWTFRLPTDIPVGRYALMVGLFRGNERMSVEQPNREDPTRRALLGFIEVQ